MLHFTESKVWLLRIILFSWFIRNVSDQAVLLVYFECFPLKGSKPWYGTSQAFKLAAESSFSLFGTSWSSQTTNLIDATYIPIHQLIAEKGNSFDLLWKCSVCAPSSASEATIHYTLKRLIELEENSFQTIKAILQKIEVESEAVKAKMTQLAQGNFRQFSDRQHIRNYKIAVDNLAYGLAQADDIIVRKERLWRQSQTSLDGLNRKEKACKFLEQISSRFFFEKEEINSLLELRLSEKDKRTFYPSDTSVMSPKPRFDISLAPQTPQTGRKSMDPYPQRTMVQATRPSYISPLQQSVMYIPHRFQANNRPTSPASNTILKQKIDDLEYREAQLKNTIQEKEKTIQGLLAEKSEWCERNQSQYDSQRFHSKNEQANRLRLDFQRIESTLKNSNENRYERNPEGLTERERSLSRELSAAKKNCLVFTVESAKILAEKKEITAKFKQEQRVYEDRINELARKLDDRQVAIRQLKDEIERLTEQNRPSERTEQKYPTKNYETAAKITKWLFEQFIVLTERIEHVSNSQQILSELASQKNQLQAFQWIERLNIYRSDTQNLVGELVAKYHALRVSPSACAPQVMGAMTNKISKTLPSSIVNQSQGIWLAKQTEQRVKAAITNIELIYLASQHNFEPANYHRACDKPSNLLTVIHTQRGYVLGGFTDVPMAQKNSACSFIFSVNRQLVMPLKQGRIIATLNEYDYGPIFGSGNDIRIGGDKAIWSNYHTYNSTYQRLEIADVPNKQVLMGGTEDSILEYQVFKVSFRQ